MKTANCYIKLDKVGSTVPMFGVTPAEVAFLVSMHHGNAGGNPIVDLQPQADVTRTDKEELQRLLQKYPDKKVRAMYAGALPNLPKDFKEATEVGLGFELPATKMIAESGGKFPEEAKTPTK